MNKTKKQVSLDDDVWQRLDKIGERYGMTANTILAATAAEISRIKPENLWHTLGRIAEGEPEALPPAQPATSRRPVKPVTPPTLVDAT